MSRILSGVIKPQANKFAFYDLVLRTPTHPHHPLEVSKQEMIGKKVYEGRYSLDNSVSAEQRIEKVFGQRIKGGSRESSSRFLRQQPRVIGGITVPAKPVEPDNCCMSGCINCVWEMFNDDIKDWKEKRKLAANSLVKNGGVWPLDFNPPAKYLTKANLPKGYTPKNVRNEDQEAWGEVPVAIKVFTEFEKKLKAKRMATSKPPATSSASAAETNQ